MNKQPLLTTNSNGFYCPTGDFYVDPWRPVPRAVITHAHADHYAWGCGSYLVAREGEQVFRARLGADAPLQTLAYGETATINDVQVSFHPAGHILGSAQIRLEYGGEVWVISGDYKTEADRTCAPFEIVRCQHFITEATFGLPIYHWRPQNEVFAEINQWWRQNADEGRASILFCYALGKAQRVQAGVDATIGTILTHGATERINRAYRASGVALPNTIYASTASKDDIKRALIIAPLSARGTSWTRRFGDHASGYASGWMRIRGARRRQAVDRGFVLSDHADWDALLHTAAATGAERIGVTHGYTAVVSRWLQEQGADAYSIDTRYDGENDDAAEVPEGGEESKAFAELYTALDETNKTNAKIAALRDYFSSAAPEDAAWVLHFLIGRRPRRAVNARRLAEWAAAETNIPMWLFAESYDAVGDMAETITLLLPETAASSDLPLHRWLEDRILPLQALKETEQREIVVQAWRELDRGQRFVYNKLITGGFRVGVSSKLVIRALADVSGLETSVVAHRLMGNWEPNAAFYRSLLETDAEDTDLSRPYPFFLAYPIEGEPQASLGDIHEWQIEWKWDGIRSQLIRRGEHVFLWSRGEELVTDRYPEVAEAGTHLPEGTALDGELLVWENGSVQPFAKLQRRIGLKSVGKKTLSDFPVVFMGYDVIEYAGKDIRTTPLAERRKMLESIIAQADDARLLLSPLVEVDDWQALAVLSGESRARQVEGFMIKRRESPYRVGRQRGDWWKWKVEPYTIDAVLIYAQRGSGKRASLYTDYTFGVWDDQHQLISFAKAYSGLTDEEIAQVDSFVRQNTQEKFGPVRTVKPELVFELGFEGIQRSARHKSGIAVRFPRILRWRHDKPIEEADTLETIRALLPPEG